MQFLRYALFSPRIRRKMRPTTLTEVHDKALNNFNTSEAFVVQKSVLSYVQLMVRNQRSLSPDDTIYHTIEEPVCKY